jgi:hypothetical protein
VVWLYVDFMSRILLICVGQWVEGVDGQLSF